MIFLSDLDNTLIYSYKKAEAGDICVEKRDGKELSFMKPFSYSLLQDIAKRCTFVPVTTRSLEQYRRIDFGFVPDYAVICHGARLLRHGEVDKAWENETRKLLKAELPALKEEGELLYDIRQIDDFFIFAKSQQPDGAVKYLKELVNGENGGYEICAVANKVYVIPKGLDKGVALMRLKSILLNRKENAKDEKAQIIAAGDSFLDIPLLMAADIAIAPLSLQLERADAIKLADETFTSEVLNCVRNCLTLGRV